MIRVLICLCLLFVLSACATVEGVGRDIDSWFKAGQHDPIQTEPYVAPEPLNASEADYGEDLIRLRRQALNYYGMSPRGYTASPIMGRGTPAALDRNVEVFPVGGQVASGVAFSSGDFQMSPQDGYEYQSMFPELGGVSPVGRGGAPARISSNSIALAPVLGSGDDPSMIFFRHGSANLGSGDKSVLNQVAEQAKFSPVMHVSVDGFASARTEVSDPVESAKINLRQSLERVNAVSSYLIDRGVPGEKLKTSTWGDTRLSGRGEAFDRRVEIVTGGE